MFVWNTCKYLALVHSLLGCRGEMYQKQRLSTSVQVVPSLECLKHCKLSFVFVFQGKAMIDECCLLLMILVILILRPLGVVEH